MSFIFIIRFLMIIKIITVDKHAPVECIYKRDSITITITKDTCAPGECI